MQAAVVAVNENRFKIREAARHFGVPHSTLISKLKGRVPLQRKMGRSTYFSTNEENLLVKYIIANAKKGIPINRQTLVATAKKILDDDKRVTPFKNNMPGKKWVALFYDRHPEIAEKKAEGISTSRALVSTEDLKQWHQSLKNYLVEENALDIIEDPKRIFNADESGFQTCPDSGKVIGPVNMKNFYEIKSGKDKEQLTVMLSINAAGQIVSPMIVYPLVRISRDIAVNVPENWSIGKSPSGWMNGPLYYEYIANVFDPWLKANDIQKPVLLLVDGHRSHLTLQVSQYCADNQIIAYALFPNSTHISQPADVSVFKCLKSGWKNTVKEYKQNSGNRQITRAGFAPLLAKVFQEKVTPDIVANGFKRCGLYPFDVNGMDLARCMDHESRKTAPVSAPISSNCVTPAAILGVETFLLFESLMRRGRAEEFRRSKEHWEGEESAKELFYTWKKFRRYCLDSQTSSSGNSNNFAESSESQREKTQSPSLLQVQATADMQSPIQMVPTIPSQIPIIESTPDKPVTTRLLSSETLNLVKEDEFLTRCNTPVEEVLVLSGVATNCSTTAYNASNFNDMGVPKEITNTTQTPKTQNPNPPGNISPKTTSPGPSSSTPEFSRTPKNSLIIQKQKQVSPAFGNHLIWPSDSPVKKTRKERLPFATSSKKWQDYWIMKDNEKNQKSIQAKNRKRIREEKKAQKSSKVKKSKEKSVERSDGSESDEEMIDQAIADSDDETDKENQAEEESEEETCHEGQDITNCSSMVLEGFNKGDYVIFVYEGTHFVGQIISTSIEGVLIKSMQKSLNNWRWPDKDDLILYRIEDIIEKIQEPQKINPKRGVYSVPEFEKYREFI